MNGSPSQTEIKSLGFVSASQPGSFCLLAFQIGNGSQMLWEAQKKNGGETQPQNEQFNNDDDNNIRKTKFL